MTFDYLPQLAGVAVSAVLVWILVWAVAYTLAIVTVVVIAAGFLADQAKQKWRALVLAGLLVLSFSACGSDETCSTYSYEECRVVNDMERQCRTVEEQQCVDGDPYYYGPWVTVCYYPYCY